MTSDTNEGHEQRGVLYVATNEELRQEAAVSARFLKQHTDVPVTIITNEEPSQSIFDNAVLLEHPEYNHLDKIAGMQQSPYDQTLYLDTDIYVNDDISDLFKWLESFDLAALPQPCANTNSIEGIPDSLNEYCTGVMPFGSDLDEFFEHWYTNLKNNIDEYKGDIAAFRQTIWETNIRIAPLKPVHNCKPRWGGVIHDDVVMLHERLLNIKTMGAPKRFEPEEVVERLNASSGNRVHYPAGGLFTDNAEIKMVDRRRSDAWAKRMVGKIKEIVL